MYSKTYVTHLTWFMLIHLVKWPVFPQYTISAWRKVGQINAALINLYIEIHMRMYSPLTEYMYT